MNCKSSTDILSVEEVANYLGLSYKTAKKYVTKVYSDGSPFRVLRIGSTYHIPVGRFLEYISNGE